MLVTLEEIKQYLRITFNDEDELLIAFINNAQNICLSIIRIDSIDNVGEDAENLKIAIMYAVAYFYEHREDANHNDLILTLRNLLFNIRQESF